MDAAVYLFLLRYAVVILIGDIVGEIDKIAEFLVIYLFYDHIGRSAAEQLHKGLCAAMTCNCGDKLFHKAAVIDAVMDVFRALSRDRDTEAVFYGTEGQPAEPLFCQLSSLSFSYVNTILTTG